LTQHTPPAQPRSSRRVAGASVVLKRVFARHSGFRVPGCTAGMRRSLGRCPPRRARSMAPQRLCWRLAFACSVHSCPVHG
jgi:hypothetical protein